MIIEHTWEGAVGLKPGKNQTQNLKIKKLSFEWNIHPQVSKH